jgi:hypothetical protein
MSDVQDNQEPEGISRSKLMRQVAALGKSEGVGSNSRPGTFLLVCEGAQQRIIGRDDIPEIVQVFSKNLAEKMGIGYVPITSEAQQVSKLKTAVYLGELTHVGAEGGLAVAQRTARLHKEARTAEKPSLFLSPFDALVNVARAQVNAQPDSPLSDEQINALIRKPEKEIAEEADRLGKIADAVEKLRADEKDPVSEESLTMLDDIIQPLVKRIAELGGTTAQKREAERENKKTKRVQAQYSAVFRHAAA